MSERFLIALEGLSPGFDELGFTSFLTGLGVAEGFAFEHGITSIVKIFLRSQLNRSSKAYWIAQAAIVETPGLISDTSASIRWVDPVTG